MSRLELQTKLGSGCFGEVWSAIDHVHGAVAVKCMRKLAGESTEEWEKRKGDTIAEGRRLAEATHTQVVKVHYVDLLPNDPDTIGLVMELCPGGSTEEPYIAGPLAPTRVRQIATDVLRGLHAMHCKGMLHRDIKPANILLGADGVAKLGDFGLVTSELVVGYGSRPTNGYANHVAYETVTNGTTSERTDIWALGMTIFRLLHGRDWFEGLVPLAHYSVGMGDYRDRLVWLPHVPKAWKRFVRQCLHDDPGLRYQNATEVLNGLAALSPVEPDWDCRLEAGKITWSRTRGARLQEVEWAFVERNVGGLQTVKWLAVSRPLPGAKGNVVRLGEGTRESELRAFFSAHS